MPQNNGPSFDALLDALAERVAAKVRADLAQAGNGGTIRPRLLTVEQAASYMGRTLDAMQHLTATGKIRTVRIDRRVFIDINDLDRLIQESKA